MHGNSVITLRPARAAWPPIAGAPRADADAVYGCVDWYLYQDRALASCAAGPQSVSPGAGIPATESLVAA